MSQGVVSPVGAAAVDGVAAATVLFRRHGRLHLTLVAKATFALVPGGAMRLVAPRPLRHDETPFTGGGTAGHQPDPRGALGSIRAPGELSPYLIRADILFVGHAHPPHGKPVSHMRARLCVVRPTGPLLDKQLDVFGDRVALPGQPVPEGAPFSRMPITYDRAFGGVGSPDNPLGVGFQPDPAGQLPLPNVMYPDGARARQPAGFGPISWFFPARRRLAAGAARSVLERPLVDLPDALDDAYFQAAPADQQTAFLRGDEHIILEGLHPTHQVFRTALPPVRAVAAASSRGGQRPVALVADTLLVDGDAGICTITWRGAFPLPSDRPLEGLSVLVGLQQAGRAPWWPSPAAVAAVDPAAAARASHAAPPPDYISTVALPDGAPAPRARPKLPSISTLDLDDQAQALAAALASLPFAESPDDPAASPASAQSSIPGAPWSDEPAPAPPTPVPFVGTVEIDTAAIHAALRARYPDQGGSAPAETPSANAASAPVQEAASAPAAPARSPWREAPPEPAPPERAEAEKAPAPPPPAVKGLFYGRFKKD